MKKILNKSSMLFALAFMFITALACATGFALNVNAQEAEPTSTVILTSFTTVMKVDEEFEFAALVTNEDGTTSTEVTWSSSDEEVIYIEEGLATALSEGNATVTATAADGASASINVYVSNSAIHVDRIELYPDDLELGVGWKTRIGYTAFPYDANDQRVMWASSDTSVVTVDENGNLDALAAGNAIITATSYDGNKTATATVTVYNNLGEATFTPATLVTMIGDIDNDLTVTLPGEVSMEGATYQWYSMNDSIASVDHYIDNVGTIFSWNFGTTTIYVVVTAADGHKYAAEAIVHVTAEFYYLTGLEEDLPDPTDDPWVTYKTEADAQAAGVLLVPDATNPYVFSITRSFWAYDNFQILHDNMDPNWTTRITSRAFVEQDSSMPYIANDAETFAVNALGVYTVTLDLSAGPAKVTIVMDSLKVTAFDLSVASENAYLQYDASAEEGTEVATRTMLLNIYTIPEAATYNLDDVKITVPASMADYVTAEAIENDGERQIKLTLLKAVEENTSFQLAVEIDNGIENMTNAVDDITITILADGETYVPVESIKFTSESYIVNVNNGAKPWISSDPIEAVVNTGASVTGVVYTEDSDHIFIEYIDDKPYVHADALGTYTIYANALGNSELDAAQATVLVTSLVEPVPEDNASGFYLIGTLNGVMVNNWASIIPEETDYTGEKASLYKGWTLKVDSATPGIYSGTFNMREHDVFSIAFLGMDGNWGGIINNQYMNWDGSEGTYWYNDINIEMSQNGRYTIVLNLTGETPSFTINRVGDYNPDEVYNLYLYIVRSGDSWNADISQQANIIAYVGYITINNGVAQSMTLTIDKVDFYQFYQDSHGEWPNIQFVTAYGGIDGLDGGYFQNATWYGASHKGVTFDGDAYIAPEDVKEDDNNYFTNFEGRSELYWVGEISEDVNMSVSFTFTFDEGGVLTKVVLNFVTSSVEPAE